MDRCDTCKRWFFRDASCSNCSMLDYIDVVGQEVSEFPNPDAELIREYQRLTVKICQSEEFGLDKHVNLYSKCRDLVIECLPEGLPREVASELGKFQERIEEEDVAINEYMKSISKNEIVGQIQEMINTDEEIISVNDLKEMLN